MQESTDELVVPQVRITPESENYSGIVDNDTKNYPYLKIYGIVSTEEIKFIKDASSITKVEGDTLDFYVTQQKGDTMLEKKICEVTMSLDLLSQLYFINGDYKITLQSEEEEVAIEFDNVEMIVDFMAL